MRTGITIIYPIYSERPGQFYIVTRRKDETYRVPTPMTAEGLMKDVKGQ